MRLDEVVKEGNVGTAVWRFLHRIVGYSIDARMKSRLAVAALDNAVARRATDGLTAAGCVVHSDRGSQFRSRRMHRALTRHDMVGSMGQVGSAADNATMESFFSLLQHNVLDAATGPPATSCASRSSPGSNAPTTADDAKPHSAD